MVSTSFVTSLSHQLLFLVALIFMHMRGLYKYISITWWLQCQSNPYTPKETGFFSMDKYFKGNAPICIPRILHKSSFTWFETLVIQMQLLCKLASNDFEYFWAFINFRKEQCIIYKKQVRNIISFPSQRN